ncbi:MAG TPA: zinc ribbon domain-containing protein, partial [Mycobacterium sp.]|nr:zinc ribbon domain-containing protein [Mycobacterium sp.]
GPTVAQAYSNALGGEVDVGHVLLSGVAIPVSEALLMLVPAVVVRAMNRSGTDPLTGFAVGALGATVFNAAASMVLLVPQLAMGVIAHGQSATRLLAEALVEGVAWPVASLATGGIFGITLWLNVSGVTARRRRLMVLAAAMLVLVVVTAMGLADVAPLGLRTYIGAQLLTAMLAVVALRIAITGALLYQAHDDTESDAQVLCEECGHAVAHRAFCTDCGVALGAVSGDRRAATYPGVLRPLAAGLAVVVAAGVGASAWLTPAARAYVCPPDCGRPPLGTPVETNPRFSGANGAFSVAYPAEGSAYDVIFDPPGVNGVEVRYVGGDTGTLWLFGESAAGRTPKQIVEQLLANKYPGTVVDYEIPNASVGYQPGYGVVADVYSRDAAASYTRLRVIVMAAVKHDYALIAAAAGPYHEFGPDYGTGHPSGANLELAMDMGKYVNSFRWNGDRYGRPR